VVPLGTQAAKTETCGLRAAALHFVLWVNEQTQLVAPRLVCGATCFVRSECLVYLVTDRVRRGPSGSNSPFLPPARRVVRPASSECLSVGYGPEAGGLSCHFTSPHRRCLRERLLTISSVRAVRRLWLDDGDLGDASAIYYLNVLTTTE